MGGCLWRVYASVVSSFHVNLLWSVSVSVPESRYVCLCAHLCLQRGLPLAHASGCVSLRASVCCCRRLWRQEFCTPRNHPLPMFLKLLGSIIAQVPGLQWYVAIQDPAVMQMNRILCAGWGCWSSWAGLASGSH